MEFGMLYARMPVGGPVTASPGHGSWTAQGRQERVDLCGPEMSYLHPLRHGHDREKMAHFHL